MNAILTAQERRTALVALIAGAFVAGVGFGALHPLIALLLEARGVDSALIGLNASLINGAILIGGPFVPRIARRLGAVRSLVLVIAVDVVLLLLYPNLQAYWTWCVLRFVGGLVGVLWWVITESWINLLADERVRTRVVGFYTAAMSLGFAVGPAGVAELGIDGWRPWLLVLATLIVGAVPVLAVARAMPAVAHDDTIRALALVRRVPLVMVVAVAAGLADFAIVGLLPLYGLERGLARPEAARMLTAFTLGNVVLQLPIAWVADKVSRRAALVLCATVTVVCAALLPFAVDDRTALWAVLFVWGGTVFSFYMVALGMLGASFRAAELIAANAAFIVVYNVGGMLGPVGAGALMDVLGPEGLPGLVGLAGAVIAGFAVTRRGRL